MHISVIVVSATAENADKTELCRRGAQNLHAASDFSSQGQRSKVKVNKM